MIKQIVILGSVLAIASVAQAAPLNVSFQGKSQAAVRADLLKAAKQVCREAIYPFTSESDYQACVSETYDDALLKLKHALASNRKGASAELASR